ncbi:dUTP diphosphatase [Salinarimonas rosea]|uniref:dUTP diphosphatase n=1 Tax=Salinarimonas rosea TaxID=552063 RepID=UPI00040107CE|nr:dUTP diphosphatase [Salinarimonas rosea]
MTATIRVKRLPHCGDLSLPKYETGGAAGLDLVAAISHNTYIDLGIRERVLVPTGFALELPDGYEAQVRPRSGLAARHGVTVLNAPGTIDADYRGEVMVLLVNLGDAPFRISRGMRIAQLVVAPVTRVTLVEVAALGETPRAGGGFGSTGG